MRSFLVVGRAAIRGCPPRGWLSFSSVRAAVLVVALGSSSCSSPTGDACASVGGTCMPRGGTTDGSSSDGAPSSCVWPASLDPTDSAGNGGCVAARAYLSCTYSNGSTALCASNDPTQCPGPAQSANGTFTCQNRCQADEYAITCGQAGFGGAPGPTPPPPPASCRFLAGVEGVSFGCCPCDGTGNAGAGPYGAMDSGGE
jgi:hypothetical protein